MTIKIKGSPKLEFAANAKDIQSAIAKVQSITQFVDCFDTDRKHLLIVSGENAYVAGLTPDAFAFCIISNSTGMSDGAFIFDSKVLIGLVKGRDGLSISCDGSKVKVSSTKGRYNATTDITEVDEVDLFRAQTVLEEGKAKKFTSQVIEAIRTGVKAAELTNFYSDEVILALVTVRNDGVTVSCGDNFHVSLYEAEVESKTKLRFALQTKTFALIDKFIGDDDAKFSLDGTQFRVTGKGFAVSLPEVQVDSDMFGLVPGYLKSLGKPKTQIMFDREALKVMDNMAAITSEDTKMAFKVGSKSIAMSLTTRTGTVEEAFKAKIKGDPRTSHIDPRIFNDLFKKVKGDSVPVSFFSGDKGTASSFRIVSKQSETSTLTQVGTFYDE